MENFVLILEVMMYESRKKGAVPLWVKWIESIRDEGGRRAKPYVSSRTRSCIEASNLPS